MVHPTVALVTPEGDQVQIDVDLAPIIRAVWAAGIETSVSCQEGIDGRAMIGFVSLADMEMFYDLACDAMHMDDVLFDSVGWEWVLWANSGLRGEVHIPRAQLAGLAASLG